MTGPALFITQCLQNDFVAPVGRYDPLPNLLHIGFEESRRLMGDKPEEGAVARMLAWTYQQPDSLLKMIHIRDWHDPHDHDQAPHLRQFGAHCQKESPGARFAFAIPEGHGKDVAIIDASGLNDFIDTPLAAILAALPAPPIQIGIAGVWTEAKVSFLAYELRTRYPNAHIAVCSALTASASRSGHFLALERLQRLLGVQVIDSLAEFIAFLGGELDDAPLFDAGQSRLDMALPEGFALSDTDRQLLAYLFRDCSRLSARPLAGGFSGNQVLACDSIDSERRVQVPHVVKIGSHAAIGKERAAFEKIEHVLGNIAPRITDFADWGGRGAIKYRYASMGGVVADTLQRLYMNGLAQEQLGEILQTVFGEQLSRLYSAAEREAADLFDYYGFGSQWADSVHDRVAELVGAAAADRAEIALPGGLKTPNIHRFYASELDALSRQPGRSWWFAHVHGDLNGANIILDSHRNVWLIDFFHTHRGHILKDLIKVENDLLYIWTPINDENELAEAARLTDGLLDVHDLAAPLAGPAAFSSPQLLRAWQSVGRLRAFYPGLLASDRDPLQLLIAQLRYAVHTLSFEECNRWQKLWALYAAGQLSRLIRERVDKTGALRVDWLVPAEARLGLTLLPGRRDYGRDLEEDLKGLQRLGVTHLLSLTTPDELARLDVEALPILAPEMGIAHLQAPILDQQVTTEVQMRRICAWVGAALDQGGRVAVHCVAGLGRSGMVAACYLRGLGMEADEAIALVRARRSPRAVETPEQERFVRSFL